MQTLANSIGQTAHLSPLLRKARRHGLPDADALLRVAVLRGCTHYTPPGFDPRTVIDPGIGCFSNLELAVTLISAAQVYEPRLVRCAAQLLSSPGIEPTVLARWARMERCVPVVRHIAEAALRYDESGRAFWEQILKNLPASAIVPQGVLPHPSRFVVQTGVSGPLRKRQPRTIWLRPAPSTAQ